MIQWLTTNLAHAPVVHQAFEQTVMSYCPKVELRSADCVEHLVDDRQKVLCCCVEVASSSSPNTVSDT